MVRPKSWSVVSLYRTLPIRGASHNTLSPIANMKILTVSDREEPTLVAQEASDDFKNVDLILSCGDLAPEYLATLAGKFEAPVYFVRGNHDIRTPTKPIYGCMDIHTQLIRYHNLRILGLEGSHWYNGGPAQYTENQMRFTILRLCPKIWIKGGVDIVITHAPPRGIHDAEDLCHQGFQSFHWLVAWFKPFYFIHGHIHKLFKASSERITTVGRTNIVNTYGYFLFEIDKTRLVK